jgi:ferredoxin-NADP reductase
MEALQLEDKPADLSVGTSTSATRKRSTSLPDLANQVPAYWQAEHDEVLICRQVRSETHDVKTFIFEAEEPRQFRYQPGQFITLELEIDGKLINRCYTLSSTPTRPDRVSITVKRVPGGVVSNWLHDHLQPGTSLRVLGPSGEFSCFRHDAPKFLFLSAGSGITPLMSMSRALHDLGVERDVVFAHSARTPLDIIFSRELQLMARHNPNFRHAVVCERAGGEPDWHGFLGFLSLSKLETIAPDFREREVFICGPAPYMAAVRAMLTDAGFDFAHYHEESFSFESVTPSAESTAESIGGAAAPTFHVQFLRSGGDVLCTGQQTVLAAARAAGMRMPASCTQGLCGTCKTKMVSGQVDMRHAGGIRQREIDQGWILPCCSVPLADIVLDR